MAQLPRLHQVRDNQLKNCLLFSGRNTAALNFFIYGNVLYYMKKLITLYLSAILLQYENDILAQDRVHGRAAELIAYPFKRFNAISPRFDHQNRGNDTYFNTYYVRGIFTRKGLQHFRIDIPLASTNATKDGSTSFGLSDASIRFTQIITTIKNTYLGAAGKIVFPTATDPVLGAGKFQAHPGIGGIYFFPKNKGSVFFSTEYRFSFAGQKDMPGIKILALAPNIDYWGKKFYAGYYATWTYDFNAGRWDIPLDVEVGYFIAKHIVLSAEYILPLINNETYVNEYALKLRFDILEKKK